MPREVDTAQRLADIAAATIAVARRSGAHAVTIRSVARELGGSTTLVTNYLPSRAALVLNALDQGRDRWDAERTAELPHTEPTERLRQLVDRSLSSTGDDSVLRTLILEIVAHAGFEPEMAAALRRESTQFLELLETTAQEAECEDPALVAQQIYLLYRGAYIASAEDPDRWTEPRLRRVILAAVDAFPRA
ncbi:TetR/AcrR family transcriptional regulator [Microbacterium sp. cx-59]|uniref:TetR/AcrR family transcriptional regulator n=1 Tax=Microbacterium sp. cx-59 TaxID=2891207 RepID=UPI001E6203EF|nr:TetR family transcriptional regulator C-terminal domain-containing protein [Microbacterium sp. cx-59]MCC4908334.1 TetR family transcriptional regulator C-terminal domain-containing protein [Microbacterium sp. cx-59]